MKKSMLETINLYIATIIILLFNNGICSYFADYIPDLFKYVFFVIWFVIVIITQKNFINIIIQKNFYIFIFIIIIFLSSLFIDEFKYYNYMKILIITSIIYTIALYYLYYNKKKEQKLMIKILLIDIFYVAVNTIIQLKINPYVARDLSTGIELQQVLLKGQQYKAIGSYMYIYSIAILAFFNFYMILKRKFIIINSLSFVLLIYLIIKAQFVICLFLLLIIIGISFLIEKYHKNMKVNLIISLVIVIIAIVLIFNLTNILIKASQIEWLPTEFSNKFIEISNSLNSQEVYEGDLGTRMTLYQKQFRLWLNNPISGSFGEGEICKHSSLLDILSLYGILTTFCILFFISSFKLVKTKIVDSNIVKYIAIYFLMLSLVNVSLFGTIMIIIYIVVPFLDNTMNLEKNNEQKNMKI